MKRCFKHVSGQSKIIGLTLFLYPGYFCLASYYDYVHTLTIAVFQSNGYWDHTAKVYPELEALYKKYQTDKGEPTCSIR